MKPDTDLVIRSQRLFFHGGETRPVLFRLKQLRLLKQQVKERESLILEALCQDLNKPVFEAWVSEMALFYEEINMAISRLRRWARPEKIRTPIALEPAVSWVQPEPKGVVLIIGPWNYPFHLVMLPLVAAMAAGNCAVVKPSDKAGHTAQVVADLIGDTFPASYLAVVQGPGSEMGPRLLEAHRFDHVFFTGSTEVGRRILAMAAPNLSPVTLELGGKSPAVVMDDARLEVAARRIMWGKCYCAGQTCIAPDYLLVHERVKAELIRQMKRALTEFYGPDPSQSDSYGRIINQQRFDTLVRYLGEGRTRHGGQKDRDALYIAPTLLDDVTMKDRVMKEEIFGPILPVISFRDEDEVLAVIRKNPDPLALYLFTESRRKEQQILNQVPFGGGCVNNCLIHAANPYLPFGGVGTSGMGRYHGKAGFDLFSNRKNLMRSGTWIDPEMKYPPYDKKKLKLVKKLL